MRSDVKTRGDYIWENIRGGVPNRGANLRSIARRRRRIVVLHMTSEQA